MPSNDHKQLVPLQSPPPTSDNQLKNENHVPRTLYKIPSVPRHLDNHHEPPHYRVLRIIHFNNRLYSFLLIHVQDDGVPTVFAWNKGGKSVFLAGNFNQWKEKIQMKQSRNDFFSIQSLPPGTYQYRFIVDGKWEVDPTQPLLVDPTGEPTNFVEVKMPDHQNDLTTIRTCSLSSFSHLYSFGTCKSPRRVSSL